MIWPSPPGSSRSWRFANEHHEEDVRRASPPDCNMHTKKGMTCTDTNEDVCTYVTCTLTYFIHLYSSFISIVWLSPLGRSIGHDTFRGLSASGMMWLLFPACCSPALPRKNAYTPVVQRLLKLYRAARAARATKFAPLLLRFCSALRVSEVRKDGPVASLHRSHLGTQSSTLPRALGTSLHRVWNPNHIGSSAFHASNASNIFQSVGSSDGHRYSLDIVIKCTDGALSLFSFFLYAVPEKNRLLDYWFWVLAMISDPLVNNPAKAGAFQANPLQQCCRCQSRALIKAVAPLVLESWDHWISRISAGRKREASLNYNLHLKIWYNVMG